MSTQDKWDLIGGLVMPSGESRVTAPYLKRAKTGDKGVAGRKAEGSLAKRLGGSVTPGSGAIEGAKGDVRVGNFLVENKTSTNDSFSVKKDHLYKIYQEALEVSKVPALAFQFVNAEGKSQKKDRWVCIPEAAYLEWLG